jgi:hypothetical protein
MDTVENRFLVGALEIAELTTVQQGFISDTFKKINPWQYRCSIAMGSTLK